MTMTEKLPHPKTVHTGRISHQDTHPDLLTPAAIRAALIKAGIALPTDPGDTADFSCTTAMPCSILSSKCSEASAGFSASNAWWPR